VQDINQLINQLIDVDIDTGGNLQNCIGSTAGAAELNSLTIAGIAYRVQLVAQKSKPPTGFTTSLFHQIGYCPIFSNISLIHSAENCNHIKTDGRTDDLPLRHIALCSLCIAR